MKIIDNDLLSIQEARILVENARNAQCTLATFPQEKLDLIVNNMAEEIKKHIKILANMSVEETDYGNAEDKIVKNRFAAVNLVKELKDIKCVGIISEDKIKKTVEVGVPVGVIVAIPPATSPVSTTIYKTLISIKSGNAVIFAPHPRAKKVISKVLNILIEVAEKSGLPKGALSYLHTITKSGALELINHKETSLIMNTGVPALLKNCRESGKPLIYGGNGNGPAFIERTADISKAVKDILDSKLFDNGLVSAAEQSVVVDSCIDSEVRNEFIKKGAYFMTEEESIKVGNLFYTPDGTPITESIGKTAKEIAKKAGFKVDDNINVLLSNQKYVLPNNPYAKEKLAPVLAYFVEDDWMHACEKCIELLLTEKQGHTLVIHSKDEEVIKQFALKKPVGRVLVNTPASFGSMGITTNLFPAFTLGSGSTGQGMTSDNVSPMNLIYVRKVGFEVRQVETYSEKNNVEFNEKFSADDIAILQRLIEKALN